ncbi:DNA cytosine methyltransferase [Rhizobium leguminosarum]|uniref:DNA cytosine methyltransferase n=1 Tax=Rhizobium leguminosarum TaxID=384 RepID=UPI0013F20D6D|nr:DNA (cytosine-5-)-methyltransferase [Rhizobium leguminosarum]
MNNTAAVLSETRTRIAKIRETMTNKIIELAAQIEILERQVARPDAREFLVSRCGLTTGEISTLSKFSKTLKGYEGVLRKSNASWSVIRGLVSTNQTARNLSLAKMASGARFELSDLRAIRNDVAERKLSPVESALKRREKALTKQARRRADNSIREFKAGTAVLLEKIFDLSRSAPAKLAQSKAMGEIAGDAQKLLPVFEAAFGTDHARPGEAAWRNLKPAAQSAAMTHSLLTSLAAPGDGPNKKLFDCAERLKAQSTRYLNNLGNFVGSRKFFAMVTPPDKKVGLRCLPQKRLKALELCAGAGGMALGLEAAGFDHVGLVELNPDAAATMRLNRPHWPVAEQDMRTIDFTQYAGKVDLLCGGLPCQAYSEEGDGNGKHDARDLFLEGARAVREINPKAFLFENVRGALFGKHADHIAAFLAELADAGYEIQVIEVNTQDYGIAQNRPRILFIGFRGKTRNHFRMPPAFPNRRANVGDVLYDLMAANGWSEVDDWAEYCRSVNFELQDGTIVQGAQASTLTGYKGATREKEGLRWARNGLTPAGIPDHAPTDTIAQARKGFVPGLTIRMRARLQDFDDSYQFVGSKQSVARQIGNAVAPRLAMAVGLAIYEALEWVEFDTEAMLWPSDGQRSGTRRTAVEPPPMYRPLQGGEPDCSYGARVRLKGEIPKEGPTAPGIESNVA